MRYSSIILFGAALSFLSGIGSSGTIDDLYEVATWRDFKAGAVTYTFDDGDANQFVVAVPMFNAFDFDMTLFTVTDWSADNWGVLKKAAAAGHEVASHSVTHTHMEKLSKQQQDVELRDSQRAIDANVPDHNCITFAYPYCAVGDISFCRKYYIAARSCQGVIEKGTPDDFMRISSIICGELGAIKTADNFYSIFEQTAKEKGWCVLLLHGIDDDGGYSPVTSPVLKQSLEYLKANEGKFWVSTFSNVVRYIKERDAVSVRDTAITDSSITVAVTDDLDDVIYNVPVTIRRPLPAGWEGATVTQDKKKVNTTILPSDADKTFIIFNVIPDGGDVVISKTPLKMVSGT